MKPEQLREIALRIAKAHPWAAWHTEESVVSFSAELFAEFQKLQDSRIAELGEQLETERLRLAACGVAALGYFEGCKDEYRSASLEDTIRLRTKCDELAAKLKALEEQEPVAWAYTINKSHSVFSAECPPDDAYDEGTLYPLYAAPVAQSMPEGYVLVPIDPTEAMLFAYTKCRTDAGEKWAKYQWSVMIAAAQGAKP